MYKFTDKEIQNYMDKHVKKVIKEMRLKAFGKYSRKQIIDTNKLKFSFDNLDEFTAGKYKQECLSINVNNTELSNKKSLSRYDSRISNILKHEIVHALVDARFKHINRTVCNDSSPIFLSVLCWFGGTSNHKCYKQFIKTNLYKEVMQIDNYEDLMYKMWELTKEYTKVFEILRQDNVCNISVSNVFVFGAGRTIGLEVYNTSDIPDIHRPGYKILLRTNTWYVGSNLMPNDIIALYNKKKYLTWSRTDTDTIKLLEQVKKLDTNKTTKVNRILNILYKRIAVESAICDMFISKEELDDLAKNTYVKSLSKVRYDDFYECDVYKLLAVGDKNIHEILVEK